MAKPSKKTVPDVVPNPATNISEEQPEKYVVTRGGHRVSDKEYSLETTVNGVVIDSAAYTEKDFWQRVVDKHPDGTKVEIVPFNKKLHRIW